MIVVIFFMDNVIFVDPKLGMPYVSKNDNMYEAKIICVDPGKTGLKQVLQ